MTNILNYVDVTPLFAPFHCPNQRLELPGMESEVVVSQIEFDKLCKMLVRCSIHLVALVRPDSSLIACNAMRS
jgi:hypothetical protein